ncbi:hypothetical protein Tco_1376351, partial [Tanacetum coccineum]
FDESDTYVLERFDTPAGNPVKKILLKLNLSDHRLILTDLKVTLTKHGRMTKPYSSPYFIANYFISGIFKDGDGVPVAAAPRAVDLADSHASTLIDQDAPSTIEPKNFKQAMIEPSWINAMQEEIHEFERLQVSELVPSYADADHAGCQDTRCSTSGSAQFLGDKLVSWSSKKQKSTAILSTEAKYISLSGCCAQIL